MLYLLIKISILLLWIPSTFGCYPVPPPFSDVEDLDNKIEVVEKKGFCNTKEPPKGEDWKKCQT